MWRKTFMTISGTTVALTIMALNAVIGTDLGGGDKVLDIISWQVVTTTSPFVVVLQVLIGTP